MDRKHLLDVCVNELLLVGGLVALLPGFINVSFSNHSINYAEWYVGYLARLQSRKNIIVYKIIPVNVIHIYSSIFLDDFERGSWLRRCRSCCIHTALLKKPWLRGNQEI